MNSGIFRPFIYFKSTTFCLLICLFLIDSTLRTLRPLRYYSMAGYISKDQEPLEEKYELLEQKSQAINALLLGSSLPMCAVACADTKYFKLPGPKVDYDLFCYPKAKFLETEIQKSVNNKLSIFNLTGNGCMISDASKLLSESIQRGIKPKCVILAIAPRDFIDNLACPIFETAYYRFFDLKTNTFTKTKKLPDLLSTELEKRWYYFYVRSDYRMLSLLLATHKLNRPLNIYNATHKIGNLGRVEKIQRQNKAADTVGTSENKQKDLEQYRHNYLPINERRYQSELAMLNKILKTCSAINAKCIVVNMPLSERNKNILPENFRMRYKSDLTHTVTRNNSTLLNLEESFQFTEQDFRDSVHPNGSGGIKICKAIARAVASAL